jgi:hypothetical protein
MQRNQDSYPIAYIKLWNYILLPLLKYYQNDTRSKHLKPRHPFSSLSLSFSIPQRFVETKDPKTSLPYFTTSARNIALVRCYIGKTASDSDATKKVKLHTGDVGKGNGNTDVDSEFSHGGMSAC